MEDQRAERQVAVEVEEVQVDALHVRHAQEHVLREDRVILRVETDLRRENFTGLRTFLESGATRRYTGPIKWQFVGPVILVNTNRYFDRFVEFLEHSVAERFMAELHLQMWTVVQEPEEVIHADSVFSIAAMESARYLLLGFQCREYRKQPSICP